MLPLHNNFCGPEIKSLECLESEFFFKLWEKDKYSNDNDDDDDDVGMHTNFFRVSCPGSSYFK